MRLILYFLLLVAFPAKANQDTDFLAAHDAFRAGDGVKLQRFAQRLKNTPLEVYVNYYQLRMDMNKADTGKIKKFLSRPEDTPMINQLRGEWLRVLGSKQQWEQFDAEYPRLLSEDAELTCYVLQSRLRNQDKSALRDARELWFSGKELPESCSLPFEAAISAGMITKQDISQRMRLALEAGNVSLAKILFSQLDGDQGVSSKALESAAADALRYLDKLKLDDPKSLTKAESTAQANTSVAQIPPYQKMAVDNPLLALSAKHPKNPLGQHRSSGAGNEASLTQGFYSPASFSGQYLHSDAQGWRGDFASGCLSFTPVLFNSGFPALAVPDGTSPVMHVCQDNCERFSLSSALIGWNSNIGRVRNLRSPSDLQLGGIDTLVVESIPAKIKSTDGGKTQPSHQDSQPLLPLKGEEVVASRGESKWKGFLNRLGLGKSNNLSTTATESVLPSPPECDLCTVIRETTIVSPMEWNPKLVSVGQRAIVLFALQRLAKQSPDLAAARWMKIAAYFPAPEQNYFYGRLAYEAARDLNGRALQWYRAAANTPLNEQQSAWRVRAALRAQDWVEVLASVNAMSEQQQRESAWRYWKARALMVLGKSVEARNLFAPLSSEHHFYGLLADDELAGTPVLSQAGAVYKPDSQAISEMQALPGVQRTLALYRMGLHNEALEEWRWVIRNFNDRELIAAAEIARRNEMYDRAIGAADRTVSVHDFGLRYLAPYREMLQGHIREHGLEEAWVYGLMRQESRFVSSAKSSVGAAGLMQIMPATARWVASKLGLKSYRNKLIHQLDTNLRLGTYYMKTILTQFDDSPVLATAAYNAGPRRAREWRGDQPLEGAIYAETIPFEETRDYVKKVLSNTVYYASQFNAPLRSLKQRLGIVAGKAADKLQLIPSLPGEPDTTTSHSTWLPKNGNPVPGYAEP